MRKKKTLPRIPVNAGVERFYKDSIYDLINEIQSDVNENLIIGFRKQAKQEKLAMDGISDWVAHMVDILIDQWSKRLDSLAEVVAKDLVNRTVANYDARFLKHLRNAGLTVRFQLSDYQKQRLVGSINESVNLIKSVGDQHLKNIQTYVWDCVTQGYDLSLLIKNLEKNIGVSKRRAKNIAINQAGRAHAIIEQARRQELGITKAVWLHSHAGKKPRPSHVAANGKEFDIEKGMYLDGEWVLPGQAINCRCGSKAIIEGIVG